MLIAACCLLLINCESKIPSASNELNCVQNTAYGLVASHEDSVQWSCCSDRMHVCAGWPAANTGYAYLGLATSACKIRSYPQSAIGQSPCIALPRIESRTHMALSLADCPVRGLWPPQAQRRYHIRSHAHTLHLSRDSIGRARVLRPADARNTHTKSRAPKRSFHT